METPAQTLEIEGSRPDPLSSRVDLVIEGGRIRRMDFDDEVEDEAVPVVAESVIPPAQVIYETPRGHVRQVGTGPTREYVITRILDDGRTEEVPFTSELVDEKVRDVEAGVDVAEPMDRDEPERAYVDYQGDVHNVIDIEGIGPEYARRLNEHGIMTTARLRYETVDRLAKVSGAAPGTVSQWQVMAELVAVKGVGPQYAEAMARAGIGGIEELKSRKAKELAGQVQKYLHSLNQAVLGNEVTPKRVKGWQKEAKKMKKVRQPVPIQ